MRAAASGKVEMVKFLIEEAHAAVDIVHSQTGNTALLFAVEKNQLLVVEYLLGKGANVHLQNAVSSYIAVEARL
jgi:ankyrin repeat protein